MSNARAACSWSSGKDSCFACYKAMQGRYKVSCLMNFISQEFRRVSFHGIKDELVKMQSESMGIPLLQREVPPGYEKYEETFRETLGILKSQGIKTLVAGDIFLLDCRNWVERICEEEGLKVVEPLWEIPSKQIIADFVKAGFKAIVTATQANLLNQDWLGRIIDETFIRDLERTKNIDLCGKNGEYHTFVFDGPILKKRINIIKIDKVLREGYWFLDIQEYKVEEKKEAEKKC